MNATLPLPTPRRDPIASQPTPDTHTAILLAMLGELRALRAVLEAQRPVSTLSRPDRARLAAILPAIGGALGSELFTVRDLFESDAAAIRLVLDGATRIQIGRLLARGEGHPIDGYLVQRDGSELNVILWRIVQINGFQEVSKLTVPRMASQHRF
jgi:hypothetical protein